MLIEVTRRRFLSIVGFQSLAFSFPLGLSSPFQDAGNKSDFAAAAIHQNINGGVKRQGVTPDGYTMENMPLLTLILIAYTPSKESGAAYYSNGLVVGGPSWLRSDNFDLNARIDSAQSEQWHDADKQKILLKAMLRSFLIERCGLIAHTEAKVVPTYNLVVAKGGVKFKAAQLNTTHPKGVSLPAGGTVVASDGGQTLTFYNASMDALAQVLTNFAGRPVQNATGLAGLYDFQLDRGPLPEPTASGASPNDATVPIFTALQESLGLRLESSKKAVESLMIDHLDHPSAN